jgi:hypothetical protein
MKKKSKINELVECVECKKKKDKADCHLQDKIMRTFVCHRCFLKDNDIVEEEAS